MKLVNDALLGNILRIYFGSIWSGDGPWDDLFWKLD